MHDILSIYIGLIDQHKLSYPHTSNGNVQEILEVLNGRKLSKYGTETSSAFQSEMIVPHFPFLEENFITCLESMG